MNGKSKGQGRIFTLFTLAFGDFYKFCLRATSLYQF